MCNLQTLKKEKVMKMFGRSLSILLCFSLFSVSSFALTDGAKLTASLAISNQEIDQLADEFEISTVDTQIETSKGIAHIEEKLKKRVPKLVAQFRHKIETMSEAEAPNENRETLVKSFESNLTNNIPAVAKAVVSHGSVEKYVSLLKNQMKQVKNHKKMSSQTKAMIVGGCMIGFAFFCGLVLVIPALAAFFALGGFLIMIASDQHRA